MSKVVRVPDGSEQPGLKMHFRNPVSLEAAGSLWAGFVQFGVNQLLLEEGGLALTLRASEHPCEDAALIGAAEWFHTQGWKS
jgi:hypothetical protein